MQPTLKMLHSLSSLRPNITHITSALRLQGVRTLLPPSPLLTASIWPRSSNYPLKNPLKLRGRHLPVVGCWVVNSFLLLSILAIRSQSGSFFFVSFLLLDFLAASFTTRGCCGWDVSYVMYVSSFFFYIFSNCNRPLHVLGGCSSP